MLETNIKCVLDKIILTISKEHQNRNVTKEGIMGGDFGIILFLFYYFRYTKEEKYKMMAENLLSKMIKKMNTKHSGYCNGLSGILYYFEVLKKENFIEIDLLESKMAINSFMMRKVNDNINNGLNEFLHGSLGIAFYFLKKNDREFINNYINYLYDSAIKDDYNTFCWIMGFEKFHNKIHSDLSLAHGMSGLIIFLVRVIQQGYAASKIQEMIERGINFILQQEIEQKKYGSFFSNFALDNNEVPKKSRLAWCYGDLGIAIALWYAGNVIKNEVWNRKALEIFKNSTLRISHDDTFITDTGICHGTSGIAMIFNRLYLNTGIPEFNDTAEFWINETIKLIEEDKTSILNQDYSLLTGLSGAGLVLLSYITNDTQSWDELFLLSY